MLLPASLLKSSRRARVKERAVGPQRDKDGLEDVTQLALKAEEGAWELPGKDKGTATPLEPLEGMQP